MHRLPKCLLGKGKEGLSICFLITMPVVIKCCPVVEDKSSPADNCDSSLLGAPGGGAATEKPLEKKEAVIWSCPIGANTASVRGAIISAVCLGANINLAFVLCLYQTLTVHFWLYPGVCDNLFAHLTAPAHAVWLRDDSHEKQLLTKPGVHLWQGFLIWCSSEAVGKSHHDRK